MIHAAATDSDAAELSEFMTQGGGIGGETHEERRANRLTPFGRMVRSDRYKYCVYSDDKQERELLDLDALSGGRRELERQRMLLRTVRQESLVDMQADPGEMKNLAKDPAYADVLKQHRLYLDEFCRKYGDDFTAPEPAVQRGGQGREVQRRKLGGHDRCRAAVHRRTCPVPPQTCIPRC